MRKKTANVAAFLLLLFLSVTSIADPVMYLPTSETNELLIIDLTTNKIIGRIDEH